MAELVALNHRMSVLDASFLYLERPNALLHVACIATVAHPLDYERLVRHVADRLHLVPRYTQRAVMVPLNLGQPTWEPDPDFELRAHMPYHHLEEHDEVALGSLCARLFAEPLDRSRPLWEMHLIDGYRRGAAVLFKVHHAMVDGASGVQLINLLMDASPQAPPIPPPPARPNRALPNPFQHALAGLADTLRARVRLGRDAVRLLAQPDRALEATRATLEALGTLAGTMATPLPPTPFNGPIGTARALAWLPLSMNEVKATKNRLGGTVNDVVLTVIAGGLGGYLRGRGMKPDHTELKVAVPVNVRGAHEQLKLGNRVSMMMAPLPIGVADPVERLRQVSAAMDILKSSGQAGQMERLMALADLLPPVLQPQLSRFESAFTAPVNTVCTNVPGPRESRYLAGHKVQHLVPLVPLSAGIGLAFAIMSYADQLTIGITADAKRVPDVWRVAESLHASFDEIWAVTGLDRVSAPATVRSALQRRQAMRRAGDN